MAVGSLHDQVVSFILYYAPNTGQPKFFHKMLRILMPNVQGQIVMGGDSNIPLDRIMDKSDSTKPTLKRPPTGSSKVACLFPLHSLIDVWWETNPTARDFTYYSQVHHTYSRIDHLLFRTPLIPYIKSTNTVYPIGQTTPQSNSPPQDCGLYLNPPRGDLMSAF